MRARRLSRAQAEAASGRPGQDARIATAGGDGDRPLFRSWQDSGAAPAARGGTGPVGGPELDWRQNGKER